MEDIATPKLIDKPIKRSLEKIGRKKEALFSKKLTKGEGNSSKVENILILVDESGSKWMISTAVEKSVDKKVEGLWKACESLKRH